MSVKQFGTVALWPPTIPRILPKSDSDPTSTASAPVRRLDCCRDVCWEAEAGVQFAKANRPSLTSAQVEPPPILRSIRPRAPQQLGPLMSARACASQKKRFIPPVHSHPVSIAQRDRACRGAMLPRALRFTAAAGGFRRPIISSTVEITGAESRRIFRGFPLPQDLDRWRPPMYHNYVNAQSAHLFRFPQSFCKEVAHFMQTLMSETSPDRFWESS
jgi:hypothetical protein